MIESLPEEKNLMKVTPCAIPDVLLLEPRVFEDDRGFFYESYNAASLEAHGIRHTFVQDNHSRSIRGVLRGLHFQIPPRAQAKLVRVVQGRVFDVAVDIRKGSASFGRYVGVELSADNRTMLYIPPGFAHGFVVLEDGTEFLYKVSSPYSPEHERGMMWNDPDVAIAWPDTGSPCLLSEKDRQYPLLKDLPDYFS